MGFFHYLMKFGEQLLFISYNKKSLVDTGLIGIQISSPYITLQNIQNMLYCRKTSAPVSRVLEKLN